MSIIRVGVQCPFTASGQIVDIDGAASNVTSIQNLSAAESVAYSVDGGATFISIGSGTTVSVSLLITDVPLRMRRGSAGGYPIPVDITIEPAVVGSGGGVVLRAAGTSLVLDGQIDYAQLTISGATVLTISGATRGAYASMLVAANGTNVPTISGADEWASSFGYLNTSGVVNRLDTWYDGAARRYVWSQQAVITVTDVIAPTVTSVAVADATPTVLSVSFSEPMNTSITPASSAFAVSAGHAVSSIVWITSTRLDITVGAAFTTGEAARTLAYTQPGSNQAQDAAGNLLATFSGQSITNNVGAGAAILAPSSTTLLTAAGSIYTGQAGTSWDQVFRSATLKIGASADGWVSVDWPNASNGAVVVGLDTSATPTYDTSDFVMQLSTASTNLLQGSNTNAPTLVGSALTPAAGVRYRIGRLAGTVTIQESSDSGATWTVRYTFSGTYTSALYVSIFTIASNTIVNPRQVGLT
ncbi:MAG: Ig-like domain-containing protein [Burkholderiaceae bacterium]|nr:Ig-like domain-containing protein [Burkholderiaceae bacterium]